MSLSFKTGIPKKGSKVKHVVHDVTPMIYMELKNLAKFMPLNIEGVGSWRFAR